MLMFGSFNVKVIIPRGRMGIIIAMSILVRKTNELKAATSAELERLRALRRIVIYQDDLDVIDQSISRLEGRENGAFPRPDLGLSSAGSMDPRRS